MCSRGSPLRCSRIALARRAYIPVEIMLLPRWFPFHLDKAPLVAHGHGSLFILCTRKPVAKNPRKVHIRELFTTPPEKERDYFRRSGFLAKAFLAAIGWAA